MSHTFTRISVEKAHEIISSGDVTVIDIRDAHAYAQGHIEHAKIVNDENIEVFLESTDRSKPLVCYCYHGNSSQSAARYFASQGFKHVYSIDGGWEAWKNAYA